MEVEGVVKPLCRRVIAASAALAIVLDEDGGIVEVNLGAELDEHPGWHALVGRRWEDTVRRDSRQKVRALLRETLENPDNGKPKRAREINQTVEGIGDIPLRFRMTRVDDDYVIALGQDIRPLAELQQRMVSAQQAMDLEYRRLRDADAHFRVLFHVTNEALLVTEGSDHLVVELNPQARTLLGGLTNAAKGKPLFQLFHTDSRDALHRLIGAVEAGAESSCEITLSDGTVVHATASAFRQARVPRLLVRCWRPGGAAEVNDRRQRMLDLLDAMPDGFVLMDEQRRVVSANIGFCELVQRADESQVVGQPLDRWLGRPGVDLNLMLANLKEHGVIRNFATVINGDFGASQEAVVTAVSAVTNRATGFGFIIRSVTSRVPDAPSTTFLPRSVEKLRGLVGRVSLKEIVKESTDLIERLCIEAALDVSGNNRAAAAQLLGLSRQSLYSKLRRHGLGESS